MEIRRIKKENIKLKNVKSLGITQIKRIENYSETLLDALEKYANEIDSAILAYNKKSCEETMMVKGTRKSSQESTNRKTHMESVEGIAVQIATKLGLNVGATRIMARNHDVGHTFFGHSGEWWISNEKEDCGIGYSVHNAIGPRELIYTNGIYDEILERIKEFNPNIKEKELLRIRRSLWLIFDGINSHNGEKTESRFVPNSKKTQKGFIEELEKCFTIKGFDRTIMPATIEGCLIRLCDKISYIPSDMADGLREGIIDKIDGDYIPVLTSLGISQAEIDNCNARKNYDSIVRKLQIVFTKDVIENSSKKVIKMSPEISTLMHELRNINNREIVRYAVLKEDQNTYPVAIRILMRKFASIVLEGDNFERIKNASEDIEFAKKIIGQYEGTPYEDFAKYISQTTSKDFEFTEKIVSSASRQAIHDEQEIAKKIVINGENFEESEGFPLRDHRIKKYIEFYRNVGIANDDTKEKSSANADADIDIDAEAYEEIAKEHSNYSMREKIALEIGAKYLTTLNDVEFFSLLKKTALINEGQAKRLTMTYREVGKKNLEDELYEHTQAKEIREEQVKETAKIKEAKSLKGKNLHDDR